MAQTKPKSRKLAAKAVAETALTEVDGHSQSQEAQIEDSSALEPQEFGSARSEVPVVAAADLLEEQLPDLLVAPTSEGLQRLLEIESSAFIKELVSKAQLEPEQTTELQEVLQEFQDLFVDRLGRTSIPTHDIELTSSEPVRSKAYRVSPR